MEKDQHCNGSNHLCIDRDFTLQVNYDGTSIRILHIRLTVIFKALVQKLIVLELAKFLGFHAKYQKYAIKKYH